MSSISIEKVAAAVLLLGVAVCLAALWRTWMRHTLGRREFALISLALAFLLLPLTAELIEVWRGGTLVPRAITRLSYAVGTVVIAFGFIRWVRQASEVVEHLERLATYDELTRVLNRRGFAKRVEKRLRTDWKHLVPAILFFVDLDGFKEVNDAFGHDQGDDLLRRVAQALDRSVGNRGLCGRLGGDEFTLVVPANEIDDVEGFVTQLRREVRSVGDSIGAAIDASVGYSFFPTEGQELATLLRAADDRMYRVKRARVRFDRF